MSHLQTYSRSLHIVMLLTLSLVLGAVHPNAIAQRQKPRPTVAAADLAQRIHEQINKERKKHRLTTLAWSNDLARIAEKHSHDMKSRNYLSHDSPEGQDFPQRYRRGGYSCEIRVGNLIHIGAENIALSHLYNSLTMEDGVAYYDWNSPQEIAHRTVSGWMNSPGHRKNILAPYWRQQGIGVKIETAPGNKIYITQNFC